MTAPLGSNSMSSLSTGQLVAIVGVDVPNHTATGLTRQRSRLQIDTRYLVGAMHVVPAVGEQWYVKRMGMTWALDRKLPYNTEVLGNVVQNPVEGMTQIGSSGAGSGPLELLGSQVNVGAPLRVYTTDSAATPDAAVTDDGAVLWNSDQKKMLICDGIDWRDMLGAIVLSLRTENALGIGTLTAEVLQREFRYPTMTGSGILSIYACHGMGIIGYARGRGVLSAKTVRSQPVRSVGNGTLTAAARMYRIARSGALSGSGALSASWSVFTPFNEENIARSGAAVPAFTSGCYITAIGGGGKGGKGDNVTFGTGGSGGGGGGGGRVSRVWIPVTSMGSTYSVVVGTGSTSYGTGGTGSSFASGSVTLTAGGGGAGGNASGGTNGSAGSAGVASASGASPTLVNGTAGATGGGVAASNSTSSGAGGGSGGRWSGAGGKGGNSSTVTGGSGGSSGNRGGTGGTPANASAGNGGAGGGGGGSSTFNGSGGNAGAGGLYGGGGGGGGGSGVMGSYSGGQGGNGKNGYILVEWV